MDTLTRWSKTVKFANPNQKYQETDLVNGFGNLPSRQLITILKMRTIQFLLIIMEDLHITNIFCGQK